MKDYDALERAIVELDTRSECIHALILVWARIEYLDSLDRVKKAGIVEN